MARSGPQTDESALERTIGLSGAMAIGMGTMIGAGIFVFPGLAVGRAGMGATLSFAIGTVVAVLIALPTAELATAMPESGGGYYFVSRGLDSFLGGMVGISLTIGLVFAAAFYLVGFGEYTLAVFAELGFQTLLSTTVAALEMNYVIAIIGGLTLTAISILGTEHVESVQNSLVGLLAAILVVLLTYSGLDVLGILGQPTVATELLPFGPLSVLTTAALVFTSYLGFAQIATVAGEIVEPNRTLPLTLVGSILIVGLLYILTMFVTASTFSPAQSRSLGETAIAEVARAHLGLPGTVAILLAGFLATLSSANATLLGGSRVLHALSRDDVVPEQASRISQGYGTPHFALSFVGGLAIGLVVVGPLDTLAEVASFLHLVMYGLLCVTQLRLARSDPTWYEPSFQCPGMPYLPVIGALATLGLIAFMQPLSQLIGVVVIVFSGLWYQVYTDGGDLTAEVSDG